MPPPGNPQSNAGHDNAEPYYSNEDVAILHDIVVLAQELLPKLPEPERLPTNALFTAYYDILPRIGVNADHDNRYARVLFKIGGLRGQGSLYEKFEEILSKMGIEIEFDQEGSEEEYSHLEDSQIDLEVPAPVERLPDGSQRGRQRRNSESSAPIPQNESPNPYGNRRNSVSNVSYHESQIDPRQFISEHASARPPTIQLPRDDTLGKHVGAWLKSGEQESPRNRGRSISTHASLRIRRRSVSTARRQLRVHEHSSDPPSDDYQAASEATDAGAKFEEASRSPQGNVTVLERDHLMQIKASLIQQHQLAYLAKRQLRLWRGKAIQLKENNLELGLVAANHDKVILFRTAFDIWRDRVKQRREFRATEIFYAHMERRAYRARGIYLLQMAFSHWSTRASQQAERTAVARRYLIRFRIFNAWKEYTAVNQLKARRNILKKFFFTWKAQYYLNLNDNLNAVQQYQANLVQDIYKEWLRKLLEVQATQYWTERAKRRTLFRWIIASHSNWEDKRTAEEERRLELLWNIWKIWRAKTESWIQQDYEAETHYRNHLIQVCVRKWRGETRVIPAKHTVEDDVATRLVRRTFGTWLSRARQEMKAAEYARLRILREAFSIWKLGARCQKFTYQVVNVRLAKQTLLMWALMERSSFVTKARQYESGEDILQAWKYRFQMARNKRLDQEDVAEAHHNRKARMLVFRQWYSQMRNRRLLEVAAGNTYASTVLTKMISKWSEKGQHLQHLGQWSRDAQFYFLTSKSIKVWKASTEAAKRDKRKDAYTQVRRMIKMNAAKKVLSKWRDQARHILDLQAQATNLSNNHNVIVGMNVFDRWRARAEELAELEPIWQEHLLRKHFTIWHDRSSALEALNTEAIITYEERRQTRTIKKWNLLTLQIGAQENYAADIREKNAKRRFRKMLIFWHHQAAERRPSILRKLELGSAARGESWSEFGEDEEMDVNSTPIPGYLATPSRRAERLSAVTARFSTTPKAPLSTPFERQLRAQWSGGGASITSARRPIGRSRLGVGGGMEGFADVPDSSGKKK